MTFNEAIKLFKNRREMAEALGVTRQAISLYSMKPEKDLPNYRVLQIEHYFGNKKI
ncbi:MAG: hypothetical protein ACO3UU_11290 [Minisyncoccia bacterium]|jgi:DNA-binding XRE family transcriptional regulator